MWEYTFCKDFWRVAGTFPVAMRVVPCRYPFKKYQAFNYFYFLLFIFSLNLHFFNSII